MTLAAILFCVAGYVSGAYPGGAGWIDRGEYGVVAYVLGVVNVAVAVWIATGSQRGLALRILLAAVFVVIVVLLAVEQPTPATLVAYGATAVVELVILVNALRVWRLGRRYDAGDLAAVFSLDAPRLARRRDQPAPRGEPRG